MKQSWGFILLGIALLASGWGALDTILTSIDTRVASSEERFVTQLKRLDASNQHEFALIRSEASEMRSDIRYIRNNISLQESILTGWR